LTFEPLLAAGTGGDLSKIALLGNDVYALDKRADRIVRIGPTTAGGYVLDPTFKCSAGTIGATQVDTLVDFFIDTLVDFFILAGPIDLAARPGEPAAPDAIVAVDQAGALLYCFPGRDPIASPLATPDTGFGQAIAAELFGSRLYVLDPGRNQIWQYDADAGAFPQRPIGYFSETIFDLKDIVHFTIANGELLLLRADGRVMTCSRPLPTAPPTCINAAQFTDTRVGRAAGTRLSDVVTPLRLVYDAPPEPSVLLVDSGSDSIFQLSLKLALVSKYKPANLLDGPITTCWTGRSHRPSSALPSGCSSSPAATSIGPSGLNRRAINRSTIPATMARWPDHYVIALTGNIGTGKSVVRKMLEHLGAFTIDADALAHRVIAPGGPGYNAVTRTFGEWVVGPDGQINRQRLGRIVFSDPEALAKLESIIHPYVRQAVDLLINRSPARLAVIEAIKIIETGLARECDALWVVHAPAALQARRLVEKRKLSPAEAQQRIAAQNPQTEKLKSADVVIDNSGGFEETWAQVQAAVSKLGLAAATPGLAAATPAPAPTVTATPAGALAVRRARPGDATTIAALIAQATNNSRRLQRADVIAAFGDKAFMLAEAAGRSAGGLQGREPRGAGR